MFNTVLILCWYLVISSTAAQDIIGALEPVAELSELNNFLSQSVDILFWLNREKDITLLAPTNDAFKALLDSTPSNDARADLLAYHVLYGVHEEFDADGLSVISTARQSSNSHANITGGQVVLVRPKGLSNRTEFQSGLGQHVSTTGAAPIKFDSGVIHIVDGCLTTPRRFSSSADSKAATAFSEAIYTDPIGSSNISGLNDVSNITVFLPIDYVWERIGNLVDGWTRTQLDRILSYHVIKDVLEPEKTTWPAPGEYESLEGTKVTISVVGDEIFINNAKIVGSTPKIFEGGIVYTTYGVLNPDNTTIVGDQPNTSDVAFEGAVMTANFSFPSAEEQSSNATTSTSNDGSGSGSSGLSTGAKAAIGVGVPAATLIASLVVAYCIVRRKRRAAIAGNDTKARFNQPLDGQASASQRELLKPAA